MSRSKRKQTIYIYYVLYINGLYMIFIGGGNLNRANKLLMYDLLFIIEFKFEIKSTDKVKTLIV